MNDPIWLAEDGRLLKDLRTSAGLDIHEFSRAASISVAQLRQLEDGGNELFYSQRIKFQMGRKLLNKLGADVVRVSEEPAPETPSLFGFSPSPANAPSFEEVLSAAPTPVLPQPNTPSAPWSKPWVSIMAGVGVLALAGLFGSQQLTPSPDQQRATDEKPTPSVALAPTPARAAEPVTTAMVSPALTPSAPAPSPVPVAPPPAVTLPPVAAAPAPAPTSNTSACRWDSAPGNSFMPRGMEKPSTYVHFVANADASICVQDRNQKVTQVNLKAGEKLTVRGAAPWRIQTSQWAGVGVFFQGYRMPVPASASLVTLNPRLEPLNEATAQTN
jgi:transcriptional regulator with XRE-family HTH domain